jgi:hypothetical protein
MKNDQIEEIEKLRRRGIAAVEALEFYREIDDEQGVKKSHDIHICFMKQYLKAIKDNFKIVEIDGSLSLMPKDEN